MTLKKQLWIGIVVLMSLAFIGSFVLSSKASQDYLLEQLQHKNIDNVNSLALSLSHSGADPVMMELLIAAQFDSGHYRFIRLRDHSGNFIINKKNNAITTHVPSILPTLFPIEPKLGIAHINNGWQQTGTLELQSNNQFAYRALWKSMIDLMVYFASGAIAFGLIGSWLLGYISRPLAQVVGQANALGERRFIITKEPSTEEFKTLTRAMNSLTQRVKGMLDDETQRLQKVQRKNLHDDVTGLMNRQSFIDALHAILNRDDNSSSGAIVILRIKDLNGLNRRYGRAVIDKMLIGFSRQLQELSDPHSALLGRLNGSDFIIVKALDTQPEQLAEKARSLLIEHCHDVSIDAIISAAASYYAACDSSSNLLTRVDTALANAEKIEQGGTICVEASNHDLDHNNDLAYWQTLFETGINSLKLELVHYPVIDAQDQLLHWESPCRLIDQQRQLNAGQFLPWLHRFELIEVFDLAVLSTALASLTQNKRPLAINLNPQTLGNRKAVEQITELVKSEPELSQWLWLEFSETGLYQHIESFKELCRDLKTSNCKLGIEHVGNHIARIGQLHDLGLDYVKIDASLTRGCSDNRDKQIVLQGLRGIAHNLGVKIIAEGIENEADWTELVRLGFDGGTGPWVQKNES